MKRITYILAVLFLFSGCESFLDTESYTKKNTSNFPATQDDAEQMITGIQGDTGNAVSAMNAALPEVEQGIALASLASDALGAIESGAREALARAHEIADATHEQSAASTSIAQQVESIAQMVEETSASTQHTADSAHDLDVILQDLLEVVLVARQQPVHVELAFGVQRLLVLDRVRRVEVLVQVVDHPLALL